MRYAATIVLLEGMLAAVVARAGEASIRETTLEIPTYLMGPEDKNPPLWNPNVYPYPMQTTMIAVSKGFRGPDKTAQVGRISRSVRRFC